MRRAEDASVPDGVLVVRFRDSSCQDTRRAAFSTLYERYSKKLSAHLRTWSKDREAIQDMVHDTFCLAQRAIASGVFRDDGGEFSSWIYSIASNVARGRFSKRSTELRHADRLGRREAARDIDSTSGTVDENELSSMVAVAMTKIQAKHRLALTLAQNGGLKAVMKELGISKSGASRLVMIAKRALADMMPLSQPLRASCEVCGRLRGERQNQCDWCRQKAAYRARKTSGVCTKGCGRKSRDGDTRCQECRNKTNSRRKAAYVDRKSRGLCVSCNDAVIGSARCDTCASSVNGRKTAQRTARHGLCLHCERPAIAGAKRCRECVAESRFASRLAKKSLYESRRSSGLCVRCAQRLAGGVLCGACLESDRVRRTKKAASTRTGGLCRCGGRIVRGLRSCKRCVDRSARRDKERYASRRAAGLCGLCGASSDAAVCHDCRDRMNARRKQRIAVGLCQWCRKSPVVTGRTGCAGCLKRKALAERRRRTKSRAVRR